MGSVFTGRAGMPGRTKVLLVLLLLVLGGALTVVYLRKTQNPRERLASGELTDEDMAAFRANPETWINLVGDVMRERAEAGDIGTARSLSRLLIGAVEEIGGESQAIHAQLVAWMHQAAVGLQLVAPGRSDWVAEVGGTSPLRIRVACVGFGPSVLEPGGQTLAPALAEALVAGVEANAALVGAVRRHCLEALQGGFMGLLEGSPEQLLALYVEQAVRLVDLELFEPVLSQSDVSLRALDHVARAVDILTMVAEEADDSDRMETLEAWRLSHLVPLVVSALDETAGANPDLWEAVDEAGTPRAAVLLLAIDGEVPPLSWYSLVDRLTAAAPERAQSQLLWLHEQAEQRASEVVLAAVAPVTQTCHELVVGSTELAVVLEEGVLSLRSDNGSRICACIQQGLAGLEVAGSEALLRPLTVSLTVSHDQNGSDGTID